MIFLFLILSCTGTIGRGFTEKIEVLEGGLLERGLIKLLLKHKSLPFQFKGKS